MSRIDDDSRIPSWRRYLRFWRSDPASDVGDELEFHLQSLAEELVAAGLTQDDARAEARRRIGDVEELRRTLNTLSQQRERRMARTEWLDAFRHDLVFGLRQLRKSPAFTAVAVLTLALGIGANSAIFSVVYSVLLQPLPYAHADRIVRIGQRNGADDRMAIPFGNVEAWRTQTTAFDAVGAMWYAGGGTLTGQGDPRTIAGRSMSADFWKALFIPPVAGRYFTHEDDREGAPQVTVLSHALWLSQFNGDRNVVGRVITLDGQPVTIIGVAPPEYILAPPNEVLFRPIAAPAWRLNDYGDHEFTVYGLLKPGASAAVAVKQIEQIERPLAEAHPHNGYDGGAVVRPLVDDIVGDQRLRLYLLLGAVGLVLLIACGNIANLLLARATVRRGEIAVRGALGATRARIVMQMLSESLLLAVGGALLGLAIASVGMRFLVSAPAQIPRLQTTTLNGPVVGFTLALSIVCAVVFGLVPALRAARLDLQQTLRDSTRDARAGARERLRGLLVVSELCVAQVLLIGAGLLIRSSMVTMSVPVGFDTHNLLALSIGLPDSRYRDDVRVESAFQQIEGAIAAVPGVKSVGRTQVAPIFRGGWDWTAQREGSDGHDDGAVDSDMRFVSPNYFATLGLRVLRGRAFTAADGPQGLHVAIVSRGLAKRLYGNADPIGRRISNSGGKSWLEIVGVVDDMHADGLKENPPRELYMPTTQRGNTGYTLLVRGSVPVTTLVPAIRRAVASVDPLLALSGVATMDQALDKSLAMDRFTKWLLVLLGGTGLVLAMVGVYGVIAYFVTQRTHELGVRLALGASASGLRWLVVRQGLVLAGTGVALGALASLMASRLLESMLFGVTPRDPITFGVVTALLVVVAVGASYIPARRATRIDPLEALRST
jgi:putative ABC transport system permease protein